MINYIAFVFLTLFIMGVIDHSVLYSVGAVVMGMIGLVKYYEDNSTTPKS